MATGKDGYSPYRGVWIIVLILLIIPVPLIYLFRFALASFPHGSQAEVDHMAIMFGMIVASIFDASCMLTGFLNSLIREFFERLAILFKYLFISPKNAIRYYLEELHEHGIALWIYLAILAFHFIYTVIMITTYISTYAI